MWHVDNHESRTSLECLSALSNASFRCSFFIASYQLNSLDSLAAGGSHAVRFMELAETNCMYMSSSRVASEHQHMPPLPPVRISQVATEEIPTGGSSAVLC